MTEMAKEILQQAGWVDWTNDDNWIYPLAEDSGYMVLADLEKIINLTVLHCIRICVEEQPYPRDSMELIISDKILKSFNLDLDKLNELSDKVIYKGFELNGIQQSNERYGLMFNQVPHDIGKSQ
jgi:hypothetical protein